MQEIRAVIRPNKLIDLQDALRALPDFPGMSVAKIEGFTAPKLIRKQSDAEHLREYSPKIMLSVIASDAMSPLIVQTIIDHCATGQMGDGLVWTTALLTAVKVKNAESLV